jgi:hypothetical protein
MGARPIHGGGGRELETILQSMPEMDGIVLPKVLTMDPRHTPGSTVA